MPEVKLSDSALKGLDRIERRDKRLKRRKNRQPVHGKGLLTVTEALAAKRQREREIEAARTAKKEREESAE